MSHLWIANILFVAVIESATMDKQQQGSTRLCHGLLRTIYIHREAFAHRSRLIVLHTASGPADDYVVYLSRFIQGRCCVDTSEEELVRPTRSTQGAGSQQQSHLPVSYLVYIRISTTFCCSQHCNLATYDDYDAECE